MLSTPFLVLKNVFDGHLLGPQYFIITIGALFTLVISFYLFARKDSIIIKINIQEFLMLLALFYLLAYTVSTLYGIYYAQYLYILGIFALSIFMLKTLFWYKYKQNWHVWAIVFVFIFVSLIEGVYGLIQQIELLINPFSNFKIIGTYRNPGVYSNYLAIALVFAWGVYLYGKVESYKYKILRHFALITAIIITIVLPFTKARTSWLAAIVGIFAVSWPFVKTMPIIKSMIGNTKRKALVLIVLVAAIIFSSVFLYQYKIQSAKGRLLIYRVSINMIKEKPIFGHGFCRFTAEYNNYQANYFKNHPNSDKAMLADNVKTGFNEFIQITVELGLTGLLLLIGFVALLFRSKPKPEWEYLALPAKGALLAVSICCLFSYPLRVLPVAVAVFFLLAIVMATNTDNEHYFKIGKWVYKPLALVTTIIALFFCYSQWKDYEARKQWNQAIEHTQVQDYKRALPCYLNAYKVLNYDGFFLYNYGSELLDINPIQGTKILEEATRFLSDNDLYVYLGDGYHALKMYEKAENCYLLSSFMVPCKFYPRYQLFKLYCETNQYIKAQTVAKTIAKMNVKIPSETVSTIKCEVIEWIENQK